MHMIAIRIEVTSVVLCFLNHNPRTQVSAVEGSGQWELAEGSRLAARLSRVLLVEGATDLVPLGCEGLCWQMW